MISKAHILDCTIRDGSYAVDYQFTVEDTKLVAAGLAEAGIRRIEVGHGVGLNAQNCGKGHAAISDTDYIRAACSAVPARVLIGSFFIPGIGTEDSLRAAADAGLGFVRVGVDVDDYAKLAPFIRLGKALGFEVWANLMKSYLVPPDRFADICRGVGNDGAAVIAIVDSAGGMTPDVVAAYTSAAVAKTTAPLAFHGHNNLTLAVANCLRFVDCGGSYVDGTLSGIGRSGGNAATELLAALLEPRLADPLDWKRLVELADAVMQFCVPDHARPRASDIATGLNYFHSSFREKIVEPAARVAHASLFRTILNLPANSRKTVTPEIARAAAELAATELKIAPRFGPCLDLEDTLERQQPSTIAALADWLAVLKGKSPLRRVISVALANGAGIRVAGIRRGTACLVAHIEVVSPAAVGELRRQLADTGEFWLLDRPLASTTTELSTLPVLLYDDNSVVAQSVADSLQVLAGPKPTVALYGESPIIAFAIARQSVLLADGVVDVLLACDSAKPADVCAVERVRTGGVVLLVRPHALTARAFASARERGLTILRVDCGAALVAEAERLLATYDRHRAAAGEVLLAADIRVVAGGLVGHHGDIVIDSRAKPRFILGVADGEGGLQRAEGADSARVRTVERWIMNQWGM
jgi:4-hydroxy-2-oxovalerate aldolase